MGDWRPLTHVRGSQRGLDRPGAPVARRLRFGTGRGWEWANEPQYPEKYADLAIRLGINYVTYAMTH